MTNPDRLGIAELQTNLTLIDHKIDTHREDLAAGSADRLWAGHDPTSNSTAR